MVNKNKIGAIIILGGIALLGYYYFKKNKPTIAKVQLKGLEELSNYYKSGGDKEDTKINVSYEVKPITNSFQSVLGGSSIFLDPSFTKELQNSENERRENMALYGTPNNPNKPINNSNSMFPDLQNLFNVGKITLSEEANNNLNQFSTMKGLENIDWSKVKF